MINPDITFELRGGCGAQRRRRPVRPKRSAGQTALSEMLYLNLFILILNNLTCSLNNTSNNDMLYIYAYMYRWIMDSISYTSARSNLAKTMEKVCDDHAPIAITRKGEGAVVMISMDDYQALEETAYLLRSPKNLRRLVAAITELESGKGKERELLD